jgi:hypothetical protein
MRLLSALPGDTALVRRDNGSREEDMNSYEIASYTVETYLERVGRDPTETRRSRTLELPSNVFYHGIVIRAYIGFSTFFDRWVQPDVVGYYSDANPYSPVIYGWFPVVEFPTWYDIVRNEKPVRLEYDFREPGAFSGYLRYLGLTTRGEPLGEGPVDESVPSFLSRAPGFAGSPIQDAIREIATESPP